MSELIWLHEDMLRADHPVFAAAPDAPACFMWDDAYMAAQGYGLKRRVFIYESLLELPVEIYQADTLQGLRDLAAQHGADTIVTGKTPNPAIKSLCEDLRDGLSVTTLADTAFVQMDNVPELKRFFKYWNKAKKNAFKFDGRPG